jgi:hypothetical protein
MQGSIKPPNIKRISLKDWLKGTVTAYEDGRTPIDGLKASINAMLDQDGTVRPRPSLVRYGTQPSGTILGAIYEFTKQVSGLTNENYMMVMQVVAGVAKVYYSKDGGAWTAASGKTYDTSASARYAQVDNKILIMNGTDNLSYFDISTMTVVPFTALATPTMTSVVATGLAGTTFTYFYRISANSSVGETAASTAMSVQVGTQRDLWTPASQFVTVTWPAVTGAVSYNVYMGSVSGEEVLICAGINSLSFKDDGSFAADVSRTAPLADTTAGPKVTRAEVINGQVFMTGDKDNPRYVRFGGTGANVLDFTPFNGGGWSELGRGTKEIPVRVMAFRDGRGNPQITVLCRGTNGQGKRYILSPDSITLGDTVINFFEVTEDNGQDGTDSPDAVILYNDSLWYPSRDGFKTTGTKPQLQNILSTGTVSETIINDVKVLNSLYMDKAVGLGYQNKLFFALPNGSTTNNEIWVLDLQREGAWMKPWSIGASWMMLYNDNAGFTHHIILSNNVMYELTDAQATYDDGVPFSTNITSGIIKFSEDGLEWASVIDVTFVLLRPVGLINFTIAGKTEDEDSLQGVGQASYISSSSVAGWGEAGWGGAPSAIYGWSDFTEIPISFGDSQKFETIEIDEELQWLTFEVDTTQGGVFFQLADVIIRYVPIGVKDLT